MTYAAHRKPVRSKAEARALGESIARKFTTTIPVDPERIARELGVSVMGAPEQPSDLSGALVLRGDLALILYNRGDRENRQRFTIAHELGHLLMHTKVGQDNVMFRDDRSSKGTIPREIQANSFAAALLIPERAVRQRVKEPITFLHDDDVEALAHEFVVSPLTMSYRLQDLNLYYPL